MPSVFHLIYRLFCLKGMLVKKWLVLANYKPPKQRSKYIVEQMSQFLDQYSRYESVMVLRDFNLEPGDITLSSLIQDHDLHNMIKHPTCFQSSNVRCIDLIFTSRKHSLMHSKSFETGFSHHHHMIYTILKITFIKFPPKKVAYRDYKNWFQLHFKEEPMQTLTQPNHRYKETLNQSFCKHLKQMPLLKQR